MWPVSCVGSTVAGKVDRASPVHVDGSRALPLHTRFSASSDLWRIEISSRLNPAVDSRALPKEKKLAPSTCRVVAGRAYLLHFPSHRSHFSSSAARFLLRSLYRFSSLCLDSFLLPRPPSLAPSCSLRKSPLPPRLVCTHSSTLCHLRHLLWPQWTFPSVFSNERLFPQLHLASQGQD